jgi:Rps23 Pro-64 3,4-dihydroxylase Tpa1-like proline 4-hydroxylase
MNTLIENGYIIEDAKDLLSEEHFKELDTLCDEINASQKKHTKFYQFEYCLTKEDVEYFGLTGHKSSVKFADRIEFGDTPEKNFAIEMKKKLIQKYFDSIQTYAESFYKIERFSFLSDKISHAIADKYYSHIFNLDDFRKKEIRGTTQRIATYDDECHIAKHRDGFNNKRLFVILIYLNKEWEEINGGDLVIYTKNNDRISLTPKAPSVCVLDFTKNNLEHEVLKVIDGTRYTYVSFYEVSETLTMTNEWKEHKIKKLM